VSPGNDAGNVCAVTELILGSTLLIMGAAMLIISIARAPKVRMEPTEKLKS